MDTSKEHLDQLAHIRTMMERSTRFISLSGLSGIFAGIFALIGAGFAVIYLKLGFPYSEYWITPNANLTSRSAIMKFFIVDASLVLIASIVVSTLLTVKRANQNGQQIWNVAAKRLFINMAIPLLTGGLFCLIAYYRYGYIGMIAPLMLIFYGLALLNASKYTLDDVRYLALAEIVLGLFAFYKIGYGLLFWTIGFGVLHIVYGAWMWIKYERNS
ncbi:MAG TPA: hypothetical protein PK736_01995 [Bacteroidia bacterium]|nr:hypothetical protein [Bacteroidota bacterium]HRC32196.1 hypothetical protein [Bacteroidia bacterium]